MLSVNSINATYMYSILSQSPSSLTSIAPLAFCMYSVLGAVAALGRQATGGGGSKLDLCRSESRSSSSATRHVMDV